MANEFVHKAEPKLRHQHAHLLRSPHENIHDVLKKTLRLFPIAMSRLKTKALSDQQCSDPRRPNLEIVVVRDMSCASGRLFSQSRNHASV